MSIRNVHAIFGAIIWLLVGNSCKAEKESLPPDNIIVSGKIENYDENKFQISYHTYSLLESTKKEVKEIDEDGNFHFTIDTHSPIKGALHFGRVMKEGRGIFRDINFYLEPGDSLNVQANMDVLSDIDMVSKSLAFTGSGVDNNYYIKREDERFNSYPQKVQNNHMFIKNKKPAEYKATVDSLRDLRLEYLKNYSDTTDMSPKLVEVFEDEYNYLALVRKFNYPSGNTNFNDGVAPELPDDYYDFAEEITISEDLDEKGLPYMRSTHFYLNHKYNLARQNGYEEDYLTFIDSQLEGRAKYIYLAYSLGSNFNGDTYSRFGEDSPYPDITSIVKKKYGHLEKMLPGQPAPKVVLTSIENDTVRSSDFYKDKFIYIDFWATWCKPCIKQIPDIVKLEKEYHDKNIRFVSISFDQDKKAWENYVKKEGLEGIQFWVDAENKKIYDEGFNITMIPRFVLIDDKGKIVDPNAPYPSSGEDIRKLLNESLANSSKI